MKFKRWLVPLHIALVFNLLYSSLLYGAPKVQLSIIYTNDVMGEVEPCG